MQVLLWNYPGQAFTTFRKDATLNNEYLANCLDALLCYGRLPSYFTNLNVTLTYY